MKKLSLLIVVAMLATALLAAAPPGKLVRLTVYNQTGDKIYMKLEGRITGQFYYLTFPTGWSSWTVLADKYDRTTWACGYSDSGTLGMYSNVRLNFVPCNRVPTRILFWWDPELDGVIGPDDVVWYHPNFGEPTMEKIFYWTAYSRFFWLKTNFWFSGTWLLWLPLYGSLKNRTYSGPVGMWYRYQ